MFSLISSYFSVFPVTHIALTTAISGIIFSSGIIPLENMIPEVALVKAMWVTGNTEKYDEIKENMLNQIASEFTT